MTLSIDLSRRHFSRQFGPLLLIGTWLRDPDAQWRPALVLIRSRDELNGAAIPCVVPLDTAWIWSEEIGNPEIAARATFDFAKHLHMDDDMPRSAYKIATIIRDHLDDLVAIPPLPPGERDERVVAEGVIRDLASGTTTDVAVRA